MRRARTAVLWLVLGASLAAQSVPVPQAVRTAADRITAAGLAKDLEFFASDELLGRNTHSPGFDTAARFVAARLEKAGLKPAGDQGSYFQHYEMHERRLEAAGASIEIDGKRFPLGDGFVVRSFAGSPADTGASAGALPVVYVGHGWVVPDRKIDPFTGVEVAGKLVLAHGPRALPKGVEIRQIGRTPIGATNVVTEAARRGAAAVIFIPLTSAVEDWARMREQNLVRRELEPSVPSAYAAPPRTSLLLSRVATDALMAGEKIGGAEMIARGDAADYPSSFQLKKSITLHLPSTVTVHRPYNVVAILEGNDPRLRNEYITVESHLDGAVGTRAVDGDAIYNSADDNATGSAGALAIAEQVVTVRPRRSLVFIWDSGEEQGLWGTRFFVANPPVPLAQIVAHFNIDMIGATRRPGSADESSPGVTGPNEVYVIGPGILSAMGDSLVEAVNDSYLRMKLNRAFDSPDSEFFYPRTDAGPFLERGILTIGFFTGIHPRYHQPSDEARYLDPQKMETVTRTAFAVIHAFADSPDRPRIDRKIPSTVPDYRRVQGQ